MFYLNEHLQCSLSVYTLSIPVVKVLLVSPSLLRSVSVLTDPEEICISGMQGSCEDTNLTLLFPHKMFFSFLKSNFLCRVLC